jgi:hypothetical protein
MGGNGINKRAILFFDECYAKVELEMPHEDSLILTVNELDKNEEKSTVDNEILETVRTSEIYIGVEEARELIRSLEFILPKEDKE